MSLELNLESYISYDNDDDGIKWDRGKKILNRKTCLWLSIQICLELDVNVCVRVYLARLNIELICKQFELSLKNMIIMINTNLLNSENMKI